MRRTSAGCVREAPRLPARHSLYRLGLIMMITPAAVGLIAPLSGILSDYFSTRGINPQGISIVGLLVIGVGCLAISTLTPNISTLGYLLRMCPLGIGFGLFISPNNSTVMGAAQPERLGVASGLMSLTRNLGQTLGMPIMGAIFTSTLLSSAGLSKIIDITAVPPQALAKGLANAYRIGAFLIFAITLLTILTLWLNKNRTADRGKPD